MAYSVQMMRVESHGDREVIVRDQNGLPPIDINMYVIRFRSRSESYRKSIAYAITKLYLWAEQRELDITERMRSGEFLTFIEIESLREFMRLRFNAKSNAPQTIELAKHTFVSADTYRRRCERVINYLRFLGNVFAGQRKRSDPYVKNMNTFITQCGQILKEPKGLKYARQRYGLSEAAVKRLLWWIDPENPSNPFQERIRLRNQLIVHMLLLTGIRDGELLSLRSDALIRKPYGYALKVTQNTTLDLDPRLEPPQVKTYSRDIPVSDKTAVLIDTYIRGERKQRGKSAAKAAPYLFLNSNLTPKPMTISVLTHICDRIKKVDPETFKELHPYLFRHTFNDLLVLTSDLSVDSEEFKNLQRELCGWARNSEQGKIYTKRSREILASECLKKMESQFIV